MFAQKGKLHLHIFKSRRTYWSLEEIQCNQTKVGNKRRIEKEELCKKYKLDKMQQNPTQT